MLEIIADIECIKPQLTDLKSIILSETYGISIILISILSIISSFINVRIKDFNLAKLKRYNLIVIFLPLLIHTIFIFLISLFPKLDDITPILIESFLIIFYILILSKYILQPFYDKKEFKKIVIQKVINNLLKENKNNNKNTILNMIKEYKLTLFENSANNSDLFSITENDKRDFFEELFKKILNDKLYNDCISDIMNIIGNCIFENTKDIYKYDINNNDKIKYLLSRLETEKNNKEIYEEIFNLLYVLQLDNENIKNDSQISNLSFIDQEFSKFMKLTIKNPILSNYLIEILFCDKWNKADVKYLSQYFKIIIRIYKEMKLNEENEKKIEKFIELLTTTNYKDKNSDDKEMLLKIICTYIRKEVIEYV